MSETKGRKLTIKQKKFVKAYVETGEKTAAYKQAYDVQTTKPESIQRMAVETSSLPHVKQAIEDAMVKLNLTPERALKPVDDALDSPDLETRLKGHDRYVKLVNLTQGKAETPTGNIFINGSATFNAKKYVGGDK